MADKAPDTSASKTELESAGDFLQRHNFKTLVEWVTAEVILNRPADPVTFLRDIVAQKIEERTAPYDPSDCVAYAKRCYQEASETADEEGQIHPRETPKKPTTLSGTLELKQRLEVLEQAIKSSHNISAQLDPFDATEVIVRETCTLLKCDRATLFQKNGNELSLMVAKGAESIRLPMGQGIAGSVAATGTPCNIPDAYSDARFSSGHDEQTGYKTTSILASPVVDLNGETVGVIQAINKLPAAPSSKDGTGNYEMEEEKKGSGEKENIPFSEVDEEMIQILATQAAVALNNANLYQSISASQAKVQSLLEIIQAMHSNLGINSLLFTITQRAHELVEADRCTMFLLDKHSEELMSLQGEVNIRIPMNKGIAGECCVKNEPINIPDAYEDPRFNQEIDKKSGYHTRTILCVPTCDSDGSVVGVIQLINKRKGVFDDDDINIMNAFLVIAGPVLAQSQLFQQRRKQDVESNEFTGKKIIPKDHGTVQHEMVIEEGEEEEED